MRIEEQQPPARPPGGTVGGDPRRDQGILPRDADGGIHLRPASWVNDGKLVSRLRDGAKITTGRSTRSALI